MKQYILLLVLMVMGAGIHAYAEDVNPVKEGNVISGHVVEKGTENSLPYATILIVETGEGTVSNEDGEFRFKKVPAGKYTLRVQLLGYETQEKKVTVSNDFTVDVHFLMSDESIMTDEVVVLTFLFNSNFYCIYGHDSEVSCNGFLFNGSSRVMRLKLSPSQSARLDSIVDIFRGECGIQDNLQEEMLRIILKRFIITCTRIAREKFDVDPGRENMFDVIRQFYVLVDSHFKEKKQVQDYADMLCRSPKTISNLFSLYGLSSPLRVIHERVDAEAKRLLLYTGKSAKEISEILGFEDLATFSRFFKKMNKESLSEYRKREKRE